jgi:Cu(I)/Ag(I) efflux system membrane fusion protein
MSAPENGPTPPAIHRQGRAALALRVVLVRLRFLILLAGVLLLVGAWPALRGYWDRWTRPNWGPMGEVAMDMEYWCPMCPGVVSDWPGKCPVCKMTLVRRQKGDPTPLPDGVVARMQFSPYRLQLAGIRTAEVECRPLQREVVLVGTVARADSASVTVTADLFEKDRPFLTEGQSVEAVSDLLPGHLPFRGEVAGIEAGSTPGNRSVNVRLRIVNPDRELRPGTLVTAHAMAPITRLKWWRRAMAEESKDRSAVEAAARGLMAPAGPAIPVAVESLAREAVAEALNAHGFGLAVPRNAVIDHGSRRLAFIETGAGMFDAVEVTVGRRCGDYYPVLRGLEAGQRVAVAGAFLLDAEMWLNHGLAAAYFGATRNSGAVPTNLSPSSDVAQLSANDRLLAARQTVCPVTGEPLDSMGGPVRLDVGGQTVFVCCKGCETPLRKNPEKYLAKLPAQGSGAIIPGQPTPHH